MVTKAMETMLKSDSLKYREITETATLNPDDTVVRVRSAAAAITLTLPFIAQAAGKIYSIKYDDLADGAPAKDVTIVSAGDVPEPVSIVLDAANEGTVLFCDGYDWCEIGTAHGATRST